MIESKINLICIIFDQTTNNYKLISTNKNDLEYPNFILEKNIDIDLCLDHILDKTINKESVFHNYRLTDILLNNQLNIYYLVIIMYETVLKDSYLLNIESNINILPKNAQKIISLL